MLVFLQTLLIFREAILEWLVRRLRGVNKPAIEDTEEVDATAEYDDEKGVVFFPPVYAQRYAAVTDVLGDPRWCGRLEKVVDLGFSDASFIKYLKEVPGLKTILGVDLETNTLAHDILKTDTDRFSDKNNNPLKVILFQGNAADPDYRLIGCDAVVSIEMIEHMLPHDLERLVHTVFGFIKPWVAIFTTPNADFNVLFKNMLPNGFRHWDHKFEWTRDQFYDWCSNIVVRYSDYTVETRGVGTGPSDTKHLGCCSQLALFINKDYKKRADLTADTLALVKKIIPYEEDMEFKIISSEYIELNCSALTVHKFSEKAKHVMSECKPEWVLRTRKVMTELRHVIRLLNLDRRIWRDERAGCLWNNINWGENAPYWNQYYTIVKELEVPIQTKSEDQLILELVTDEIHRRIDAVYNEDWFMEEGRTIIPIPELMHVAKHFTQDEDAVRDLLEWNGYEVEDNGVVYTRMVMDDTESLLDECQDSHPIQFDVT